MTHVTAWPTVEWLSRSNAAATPPARRRATDRAAVPGRRKPDVSALFVAEAARRAPQLSAVSTSTWCATPLGEQSVDVCVRMGHRRIGIQFSRPYEMNVRQIDALCLVYGRFDVLFRIDADAAPNQVQAAFDAIRGERAPRVGNGVSRMRLCCASDWVPYFERALGSEGASRRAC